MTDNPYRIKVKINNKWQGIQGVRIGDNKLVTGGNIINQVCYWDIRTEQEKQRVLDYWKREFPDNQFSLTK